MAENLFELVGKITWVNFESFESGTCVCKTFLSQRTSKKDDEGKTIFNSFLITFIDAVNGRKKIAADYADNVKKDDYVRIKGYITIDKFKPKNSTEDKEVERISLIGIKYNKVNMMKSKRDL